MTEDLFDSWLESPTEDTFGEYVERMVVVRAAAPLSTAYMDYSLAALRGMQQSQRGMQQPQAGLMGQMQGQQQSPFHSLGFLGGALGGIPR